MRRKLRRSGRAKKKTDVVYAGKKFANVWEIILKWVLRDQGRNRPVRVYVIMKPQFA
jgi:hypothetical protein